MLGRLILLASLFPLPFPARQLSSSATTAWQGRIKVLEYREAGPRLLGVRARAERHKDDAAFTIVFDDGERDKISWIRVRALPM